MERAIPLEQVEEVGSTSEVLKARAVAGSGEVALLARRQASGRGRLGRRWETLDGNMFLSVLLRLQGPLTPGHWSLLAAVALADALGGLAPGPGLLRLKWPNDVLLAGGKVAGILVDAGLEARPWLVIGFGVNLVAAPAGLGRMTACVADVATPPAPATLAVALLEALDRWRTRLEGEGFEPVRDAWLALGPATGDAVAVGTAQDRIEGRFAGIGPDGALLIDGPAGPVVIRSGEVE